MSNTWFISDTHFGHANILNFKDKKGNPLRPFKDVHEMDSEMVLRWLDKVHPEDKVYHLGDVAMKQKCLKPLEMCTGRKTLIAGNHDIFNDKFYRKYFDNIRAYKIYPKHGIIFSHIPVHPSQLEYRFTWNVHGHLHSNYLDDPRYINICVEQTDYAPISFDDILKIIEERNKKQL